MRVTRGRDESRSPIERIVLTRLTTSAPQNAAQKPRTWKPRSSADERALVSHSISPLMTRRKRPSVRRMSGSARTHVIGRMTEFITPKISATARKGSHPPA